MQLASGTIVDNKFRITARIGAGGMGTVFSAEQIELNRNVALKLLSDTGPLDEESSARFLQEAQIISQLHHRNIVSIYAFGQWENTPYIAMEFVRGNSLQSLLQKKEPLDVKFALKTAIQVCSALSHAHKHGIVHRDLKPANIMIESNGDLKVIDFGFAKIFQAEAARRQQQLTEAGCAVGTILYMSPEQCLGEPVDGRTDLYGLGCVLHQCLTGRPPFDADNSVAIMFQHVNDQAPRLVGKGTDIDQVAELQRILDRAMARDPDSRYQSADEMLHDLSSAAADITSLTLQTALPSNDSVSLIPDRNHVKPLTKQKLVLALVVVLTTMIVFAIFQFTPLIKSKQLVQDDDVTGRNLTQQQYILQLNLLRGIQRLEFLKHRRKSIENFPSRDERDNYAVRLSVQDINDEAFRLMGASKQHKAFELLRSGAELLCALPQNFDTNRGKLINWSQALLCQQLLPPSQRCPNIEVLTKQFIGDCTADGPDEVLLLMDCIIRLDKLGYPDCALKLCPPAVRGLERLKGIKEMALCVKRTHAIRQLVRQPAHKDLETRIVSIVRRWLKESKDPDVLAELLQWDTVNDLPGREKQILESLKITPPASINALKLNRLLITCYRQAGSLEAAERLAAKTLQSLARSSPTLQTEARKKGILTDLCCELTETKLQLKKPLPEILAVLQSFPTTVQAEERMFRSIYYARAYLLESNYTKAQETIEAAWRLKNQLPDATQSENLCLVLLYAGYLAHKRGDERSAQDYWQSAIEISSKIDIHSPGIAAKYRQSIDNYSKDRPEPELFK